MTKPASKSHPPTPVADAVHDADAPTPPSRHPSSEAMTRSLVLALLLGVIIQGYVVAHVADLAPHPERSRVLAAVLAVPLPATVVVWSLLRRRSRRRPARTARGRPGRLRQAGFLVVPFALGLAAVSAGETFCVRIRLLNAAIYAADDPARAAMQRAPDASEIFFGLALAGMLLQLAVITLGFAFSRASNQDDAQA